MRNRKPKRKREEMKSLKDHDPSIRTTLYTEKIDSDSGNVKNINVSIT